MSWQKEIEDGKRFKFGANWASFLDNLTDEQIEKAKEKLQEWLGNIHGKSFLDIGSGSGIHSLCARMLGAKVYSFDYDTQSVECTKYLKNKYFPNDNDWIVEQGSALDDKYLERLGKFDIVYSWGVLHHTGDMWNALRFAVIPVSDNDGRLFIAIYNDQGSPSKIWKKIKEIYIGGNYFVKKILLSFMIFYFEAGSMVARALRGENPFTLKHWTNYKKERGMSRLHDYIDWAGGYPFEVAKPEKIFDFYKQKKFSLEKMSTCGGGLGCNQFVFKKEK